MVYFVQYCLCKVLIFLLGVLPLPFVRVLARSAGDFAWLVMGRRRRIALDNLQKAFGSSIPAEEKRRIVRSCFRNTALSIVDLFMVPRVRKRAEAFFSLTGTEKVDDAFAHDRGVILVISHLGSWEYLSFLSFFAKWAKEWAVIVKKIRNPWLDREVNRMRREMQVRPIPKQNSIKTILKLLRDRRGVALLIDQWGGRHGLWQEFFGVPTSTTSLPARLALQTGAVLIPAYCLREPDGTYRIEIHNKLDVSDLEDATEAGITRELNRRLEEQIRLYPEQWSWAHRRWKPLPDAARIAAVQERAGAAGSPKKPDPQGGSGS